MGLFIMPERGNNMATIKRLTIEIEPTVSDICAVISSVAGYHPGQEERFLQGIEEAVKRRLDEIKEKK